MLYINRKQRETILNHFLIDTPQKLRVWSPFCHFISARGKGTILTGFESKIRLTFSTKAKSDMISVLRNSQNII
jgi:hypothetical protein